MIIGIISFIFKNFMTSFWNSPAWSIAKKSKSTKKQINSDIPGPGNYNSNSHFSSHQPAWKIGNALRDHSKYAEQPGPGQYNISNSKSGPKITISSKYKKGWIGDALQPGPGNYNLNNQALYKNPSAFTMGAKYNNDKIETKPGPGTYNSTLEFKNNGPKIGTSKRNGLQQKLQCPGPGQYNQNRPFSAGPKYGFGNQIKSYDTLDQRPGPGQYQIIAQNNSNVKGCTIAQKNHKSNIVNSVPGPGSYQTLTKRPQSGTKIGKASRNNSNGLIGPGPGTYEYNFKCKSSNQIKFGTGTRKQTFKIQNPGPGSYDYNKQCRKGITISGYKTKQTFDYTPGPGAYQTIDGSKRPCSAKIGKGKRSNFNRQQTPGPGQYYPFEKSGYKFAYSRQTRSKDLKIGDPGPGQYDIPATVPSAPHYLIDPNIYKSYH